MRGGRAGEEEEGDEVEVDVEQYGGMEKWEDFARVKRAPGRRSEKRACEDGWEGKVKGGRREASFGTSFNLSFKGHYSYVNEFKVFKNDQMYSSSNLNYLLSSFLPYFSSCLRITIPLY